MNCIIIVMIYLEKSYDRVSRQKARFEVCVPEQGVTENADAL